MSRIEPFNQGVDILGAEVIRNADLLFIRAAQQAQATAYAFGESAPLCFSRINTMIDCEACCLEEGRIFHVEVAGSFERLLELLSKAGILISATESSLLSYSAQLLEVTTENNNLKNLHW